VDDALIFLNGGLGDLISLQHTITLFQIATGMIINNIKSTITVTGYSPHEIHYALHHFPFALLQLKDDPRYLGYKLKPLRYKIEDWIWLITKMERQLNIWYHKYLSRAGRLVLIKSILEATPVYWMSLAWIPRGILSRIQTSIADSSGKGKNQGKFLHG